MTEAEERGHIQHIIGTAQRLTAADAVRPGLPTQAAQAATSVAHRVEEPQPQTDEPLADAARNRIDAFLAEKFGDHH